MPTQVTVNPGLITINDSSSFLVTASDGSIDDNQAQGFFVRDTRLISYYEISLNRYRLSLLASSNITHHSAIYQFTNPQLPTVNGNLPAGTLLVTIRRDIIGGMHEDIDITNHHSEPVEFQLMLAIRSDFADIFEVRAKNIVTRGETATIWKDGILSTKYHNGSFVRGILTEPICSSSKANYANGRLIFNVVISPGKRWHTCINFTALANGDVLKAQQTCTISHTTEAGKVRDEFLSNATNLQSSNAEIREFYQQALVDMGALRIKVEDNGHQFWMPAAGIPWFMAVFGRDSILTSLQTMAVYHDFARGTLVRLAQLQATEFDDWHDAEPGKMLHEFRWDELTKLQQLPYNPYYGTIDTTILWIVTLVEAYSWNADLSMLDECRSPLEKALSWIDKYGDFDEDGFVEYLTRSSHGLRNQGWKDSGESMVYPNGKLVEPPIALCEVQGYVYDAWLKAALIYEVWGEKERSQKLRQKAETLYQRFNDRFWMEDEGFYCLGLDNNKQQIKSIASNPGQLLWSGIVPQERAKKVVDRLFQPDMWCGWGVRTLSAKNVAYNPISYQRGSVWPHDNSIIASGLKRYGYHEEANRIAEGIFAAASYFQSGRMPELFAGIERQDNNFPVPYPDANIPQAWAAGSIFLLIRSILGLEADAPQKKLKIQPSLPQCLPDLELKNLAVGDAKVSLRFWQEEEQTRWEITHQDGELQVYK
ncbi:MAG: amylo-alpha-1,6-glucosidase [Pelatocladus maniniholoensis HA4357-MV3]|jgi:glycogen debranching enzyme|uniref:Amylo-alpha-1,6-glucosidase n=1 Tax=Pelatocladus maniniholoensis HA4357-MV3 TaxID=1117104 RepID=A0A9E3HB82_9NOST|nr:amylo-alpha-1,6-glucosidase [Pelatocladus maniniholoensis HA4357-MV3]BAZ68579.1 amylo-alpha-1,6-glucosidase [Fischerella sp. NIES-4106]